MLKKFFPVQTLDMKKNSYPKTIFFFTITLGLFWRKYLIIYFTNKLSGVRTKSQEKEISLNQWNPFSPDFGPEKIPPVLLRVKIQQFYFSFSHLYF